MCFSYTTTRISSDHNSHTFCYLFCFTTVPFLWFVVGWSFFLFVAPSLAVFRGARGRPTVFNQDVSKWNTGAVTNMGYSKCTLSPSLWPRLPLMCFLNTTTRVSSEQFSHPHTYCFFLYFWNGVDLSSIFFCVHWFYCTSHSIQ